MNRLRRALWLTGSACLIFVLLGCDYGRMNNQESVKTYKKEMPEMDTRAIPVSGGYNFLANADADTLKNPVPVNSTTVERGRQAYGYFCIQCHGPNADGNGTVGQSFAPLPSDLRNSDVQSESDGSLFSHILLGFGRHPSLYTTVSEEDTWAIVNFIRTLKKG